MTLLLFFELVKALSKKSTEEASVVLPGHHCLVFFSKTEKLSLEGSA